MFLGLLLGSIAGFFRGWIDTVISRVTEITMAFPYLLFVIALASTVGTRLNTVTLGFLSEGAFTLIVVFGLFSWFYSARVFRGITLSLREKEFVEAARMIGASDVRIVRSHILPHLVGPLIVFSTLNVAAFIVAEAGLSFLGLGIPLPTASWGNLLADVPNFYLTRPLLLALAGSRARVDDARVQPARRRSPRRVRSTQPALASLRLASGWTPASGGARTGPFLSSPVEGSKMPRFPADSALGEPGSTIPPTPSAN